MRLKAITAAFSTNLKATNTNFSMNLKTPDTASSTNPRPNNAVKDLTSSPASSHLPVEESILRIAAECRRRGILFGTAESCTGGMIAARVTDVAGISEVFAGGVVSYANEVKTRLLGVPAETLARHGAVSAETARAMAEGACRSLGCGAAVSVTGIAGPGGGSPEKPVGTVFEAVGIEGWGVTVRRFEWSGMSREEVRAHAVRAALSFLAEELSRSRP